MNIYSPILLLLKGCADALRRLVGQRQRTVFDQTRKDELFKGTVDFFHKGDLVFALLCVCLLIYCLVFFRNYLSIDALTFFGTNHKPGSQIEVVVQVVWWAALVGSVVWFLLLRAPQFRKRYDAVATHIYQKTHYYEISYFLFVKNRLIGYPIVLLYCITIAGGVLWIILPYVDNWSDTSITYLQEARPHDWKEFTATWFCLFVLGWTVIVVLGIIDPRWELARILLFLVISFFIAIFTAIACRAAIEIFHTTPLSTLLISFVGGYDVTLMQIALAKLDRDDTAAMSTRQLGNNGTIATIIGLTLGIMALKFWVAWIFWLDDALSEFLWVEALVGANTHITLIFPCTLAGLGASSIAMIQGKTTSIWVLAGLTKNAAVLAGVIIYMGYHWIGG